MRRMMDTWAKKSPRRFPPVSRSARVVACVGTVTSLDHHRRTRSRSRGATRLSPRATLFFDLASPYTYLAADRADRLFAGLEWQPASSGVLFGGEPDHDAARAAAAERAQLLGLPFVWPEERPIRVISAMRVASLAAEVGRGAAFVLAASRLAFCGGFDIDDPEILAEAAAAAGIDLHEAFRAAGDVARDGPIEEAGRLLLASGAQRLPALRVGRMLFCGEDRLGEAAVARAAG
jgi:2-hydroxychromene-2-carboxylate isomerase